jgi:hypothetical protein
MPKRKSFFLRMILAFVFNIEQILEPLQPFAAVGRMVLSTFKLATRMTVNVNASKTHRFEVNERPLAVGHLKKYDHNSVGNK